MKRKRLISIVLMAVFVSAFSFANPPSSDVSIYRCDEKVFRVPESYDFKNLEHARLLVEANPDRFEAHVFHGVALFVHKKYQDAVNEFEMADTLSLAVTDPIVLAQANYEAYYTLALMFLAIQRTQENKNDLITLRMFQKVLGMDTSLIRKKNELSGVYLGAATLYYKRAEYDACIHTAETGISIAQKEAKYPEHVNVFRELIRKAHDRMSTQ